VPLIMNRETDLPEGHALRNFDAFDLAFNHAI
jgi:phosphonoacetate hydrolase